MLPKLTYKPDPIWKPFYEGDWDEAVLIGGRGFGKSWHSANFITLQTLKDFNYRTLLARDVSSSIDQSILETVKNRFSQVDEQTKGLINKLFEIQATQIKRKGLGERELVNLVTKGFRTSRLDQKTDLKGFENMNLAVLEEAQDIRDESRVNTLFDTFKTRGNKRIIMLNTPDLEHWVAKRYFDYELAHKGSQDFYKLIPKKLDRVCIINGTYLDNPHLDSSKAQEYANYCNPEHYKFNLDHYYSDILGYATEKQNVQRKFEVEKIKNLKLREPIRIIEGIKQFKEIIPGKFYSIGVDTSSGHGKDFTGITVREQSVGFPVVYQGKLKTSEELTANIVQVLWSNIMRAGGKAWIGVERNEATGGDVNRILLNRIDNKYFYRRFYTDPNSNKSDLRSEFGWKTTATTRQTIITDFGTLFNQNEIEICNKEEADEMLTFVWNDEKKRYEHLENEHDDLLFSDFICLAVFEYMAKYAK